MDQETLLSSGALVRVTGAGGRTADLMVWQDYGDVVMVCGASQYARLLDGYEAPMPIGFKREDVQPLT
jgi:hypothetical protein